MSRETPVTVVLPDLHPTITVFGQTYTLEPRAAGGFQCQVGTAKDAWGRPKNLFTGSVSRITEEITKFETEKSERKERVKRLKDAETDPEPALLFHPPRPAKTREVPAAPALPVVFEKIGIRGVDKRSGNALVVRDDGVRESLEWANILRPLAKVERDEIAKVFLTKIVKREAVPEPTRIRDVEVSGVSLDAAWDAETDTYSVEFEGHTLRTPADYSAAEILAFRAHLLLVAKTHPLAYSGATEYTLEEVALNDSDRGYTLSDDSAVFRTPKELRTYVLDKAGAQRAADKAAATLKKYRFDKKSFTE